MVTLGSRTQTHLVGPVPAVMIMEGVYVLASGQVVTEWQITQKKTSDIHFMPDEDTVVRVTQSDVDQARELLTSLESSLDLLATPKNLGNSPLENK